MKIEQAKQILGITEQDGTAALKIKFRRLMMKYHPDTVGADSPEHIRRAQEINEAYRILKQAGLPDREETPALWKSAINEKAFCARNIYMPYHADIEVEHLYQHAAYGKYMWDPDEEELSMFLRSLNHASQELLRMVEERYSPIEDTALLEQRFHYQAQLVYCLIQQFVHPLECLDKLVQPVRTDEAGRKIYAFRAFLSARGDAARLHAIMGLKEEEQVFPASLTNNRLLVANRQGTVLGNLSLKDDALYFCLIPLLKERMAQLKLTVKAVLLDKRRRPYRAEAEIALLFRLDDCKDKVFSNQNEKIGALLKSYEQCIERK